MNYELFYLNMHLDAYNSFCENRTDILDFIDDIKNFNKVLNNKTSGESSTINIFGKQFSYDLDMVNIKKYFEKFASHFISEKNKFIIDTIYDDTTINNIDSFHIFKDNIDNIKELIGNEYIFSILDINKLQLNNIQYNLANGVESIDLRISIPNSDQICTITIHNNDELFYFIKLIKTEMIHMFTDLLYKLYII